MKTRNGKIGDRSTDLRVFRKIPKSKNSKYEMSTFESVARLVKNPHRLLSQELMVRHIHLLSHIIVTHTHTLVKKNR